MKEQAKELAKELAEELAKELAETLEALLPLSLPTRHFSEKLVCQPHSLGRNWWTRASWQHITTGC